jgi:acyl carrier protein
MVLEALAARRRSEGRAAQIVALAPIVDTGHLTSQDGMAENFERLGVRPLTSAEVFAKLDAIVLGGAPGFLIADVKWAKLAGALPGLREARFRALLGRANDHGDQEIGADFAALAATLSPEELLQLLLGNVAQEIGQILRVPAEKLDTERSVFELGMDSLMGVELRMSVEEKFGVSLPLMALAQDVNIRGIAELIRDQLVGAAPAADDAAAGGDAAAQEHAQILSRHGSHVDADMIAETLVELEDKVQNRLIS